jgi:hypothetical protein
MNIDLKVSRKGTVYEIDFGEANDILVQQYNNFKEAVKKENPNMTDEQITESIDTEEQANCNLVKQWCEKLFEAIAIQKNLDKEVAEVTATE